MELCVCYNCGRNFILPGSHEPGRAALNCPHCHSDFIEFLSHSPTEAEAEDTDQFGEYEASPGDDHGDFGSPTVFSTPFGTMIVSVGGGGPMMQRLSIQDLLRAVLAPQTLSPDHPFWRALGMRGDPRDYIFGEGAYEQLLSQLMQQGGHQQVGLSQEAIDRLVRETGPLQGECAICQESYAAQEESVDDAKEEHGPQEARIKLACGHQFHARCIIPWLQKVASCPICRLDLLKDNAESRQDK